MQKSMCLLFKSRAITNLSLCHCLIAVFLVLFLVVLHAKIQCISNANSNKQTTKIYSSESDQKALKWCGKWKIIGNSVMNEKRRKDVLRPKR